MDYRQIRSTFLNYFAYPRQSSNRLKIVHKESTRLILFYLVQIPYGYILCFVVRTVCRRMEFIPMAAEMHL